MRAFFQNRLARVLPVYYLCLLACIPLWIYGFAPAPFDPQSFWFTALVSFFPIGTIFSWGIFILNGPCWFVCTVFVMWLFFPFLLVRAQRLTDAELVSRIVSCFWMQLIILQTLFYVMAPFLGFWPAFQTATWNPFSRLPVFMMGMYAGLLVLRHPVPLLTAESSSSGAEDSATKENRQKQQQQQQTDAMPWVPCFLGMWPVFPPSSVHPTTDKSTTTTTRTCCRRPPTPTSTAQWSRLATRQSLGLFAFTLLVGAVDTYLRMGRESSGGVGGAPWMQSIVAMTQLNIIVALTRDGGTSLASKALRTPFATWLGKLSMNVYMVHMPIILYFVFLVLRRAKPNPYNCTAELAGEDYDACTLAFESYQLMPAWGVFLVVPVTMAFAEGLHRWVEEPLRLRLRCKE